MDHRPFEDLLFSEAPLTTQENFALQEHLQACPPCRQTAVAWQEVEHQLHRAPTFAPRAGFTNRFQARLEADRQRLHRRQSLAMLSFSIGGAALVFTSLVILGWPLLKSPSVLFWAWLYRIISLAYLADYAGEYFAALIRTAAALIPLPGWMLIFGVISELCVLWIVSLRFFTNSRRETDEME